ncbi:hypothetical protein EVG20_g4123 [Dentipellis fragilis]|uniref:Uncharacterized protein n=1 Tax=Dentipellis fragilis TaxID=205917 RepID=A0A4Y9YZ67_9AGAM|nr:hypothetical protein EVG20_g4123 [Dentipellis fragilis]
MRNNHSSAAARRRSAPLSSRQPSQPKKNYKGYMIFEVRESRSDEPHNKLGYKKAVDDGYFGHHKLLLDWPPSNGKKLKTATFIDDDDMGGPRIYSAIPRPSTPPTAISSQDATMRSLPQVVPTDGGASMGVDAQKFDGDTYATTTLRPQTQLSNVEVEQVRGVAKPSRETYRREDYRRQRMGESSSQRLDHHSSAPIRASSSRHWSPEASHRRWRSPRSHSQSRHPESYHRPWNRSRSRSPTHGR